MPRTKTNGLKPTTFPVTFELNGSPVTVQVSGTENLLQVLREQLQVTSPKCGCEQGNCGACTVLLDGDPVSSCLVLAPTVQGRQVITVEGIGTPEHLHPLQKAFYENYAAQCGYCTSGMLLSAFALLQRNPHPTRENVVEAISGNLCRCTGYAKVVDAILIAASGNGNGNGKEAAQ